MPGGAGGCWGSLPHHLAVPQHAVKVRGKDGPPGCCLSTFPARPSVRNGEALSGIRRWLRVIIPLPHQPQHPNTVHGVQARLAALERQQSDPSHEAVSRAPREGLGARPCLGHPPYQTTTLSPWVSDDSHKTTCNKQSGHVAGLVAAIPHVDHTPHLTGTHLHPQHRDGGRRGPDRAMPGHPRLARARRHCWLRPDVSHPLGSSSQGHASACQGHAVIRWA